MAIDESVFSDQHSVAPQKNGKVSPECGKFAREISHEINTRLGIIKGSVAFLREILPDQEPLVEKHLAIIEHAANRGISFLRQVIESSLGVSLNFARIDPGNVLRQALETVAPRFSRDPICFRFEIQPSLLAIYGDFQQLHQILTSLIDVLIEALGCEGEVTLRSMDGTSEVSPQ